jgi:hypothetical protein
MTHLKKKHTTIVLSIVATVLSLAATAPAQQAQVAVEQPPHFVGEPVTVQVRVTGFDQEPEPKCHIESIPAGLQATLVGVSPNVSQSIQIINGRRFESITVVYLINYHVRVSEPGQYTLGPFLVTQNGKQARANSIDLTFSQVEEDPDMGVRLVLPSKPVFVGQRVPIRIEFAYGGQARIGSLNIHSPLFDRFSFIDEPAGSGDSMLPIQTQKGEVRLKADVRRATRNGRDVLILSASRILVSDQPGEFQFEPITATVRKELNVRSQRDPFDDFFEGFFRERRITTIPVRATGQPLALSVKPLPPEGRPESFAGAVGPGFAIDVSADRTVVRVGDPITLNIVVRGDGNLPDAGLSPLPAAGMDPQKFRLPDEQIAGVTNDGEKNFSVKVRVLDPSISEIPALAYSWFDPDDESYHTTHSMPIALRVMEAKLVTADDVVTSTPPPSVRDTVGPDQGEPTGQDASASPSATFVKPTFTLSGADLAIEERPTVLLSGAEGHLSGTPLLVMLYVGGLLAIVMAVFDRRRCDRDPEIVRRRKTLRKLRNKIDRARGRPKGEAAQDIAGALREMVAEVPDVPRDQVQAVLAQCETMIYAPGAAGTEAIDPALVELAASAAEGILRRAE